MHIKMWSEGLDYAEQHPETVLIGLLITLFILSLLVAIFVLRTRNELNWYEKNVLDIAMSQPEHIRCKSLYRANTEDDLRSMQASMKKHQSTRSFYPRFTVEKSRVQMEPTDFFQIPRKAKGRSKSMFSNPQQSDLQLSLYTCQIDEASCSNDSGQASSGSLQLSLSLDAALSILTVSIKQAMDLPSKREDENTNPYLKVALDIPDEQTKSEQQTKIFTGTTSPAVQEEFYFQVPAAQIASCRLQIMVYDYDQFAVDECVGYCYLTLGRLNVSLDNKEPTVFWAEVLPYEEAGTGKGYGEILFSLSYLSSAQRLTINIFKVRNVRCRPEGSMSIRVTILSGEEKKLKRKKTGSKKCTRTVHFNEQLAFNLPRQALCDVLLEIEVIHETGTFGMNTELLARMQLPLHRCKDLWRAIIHEEKARARWHSLEEP
ncbi:hypothetical protein WR25_26702 [Diploscapter pachys]|uniref:C2 domain-containing protein n=1 Tax=Diploscapter pachys TaxID=2018661 RepID=A0A2A2L8W7_9BILA|nr:hypothetical protein WR25_26702 [Diploscapter pachys]